MNELSYVPIACGDYDFLEIACMYNYDLEIITSKETLHGCALTTENSPTGEYLIIALEEHHHQSLRVDLIQKIIVKTENARFIEHTFNTRAKAIHHTDSV